MTETFHSDPKDSSSESEGPRSVRELQIANRTLGARNAKLVEMLKSSREKLEEMNSRLEALAEPPNTYGTLLEVNPKGLTAEVFTAGRRMRLQVSPLVERSSLIPGSTVRLGEGQQVVEASGYEDSGDVAQVVEIVGERLIVADKLGEESVVKAAGRLREDVLNKDITPGQSVIVDRKSGWAFEAVSRTEVTSLVLEEVPDINYSDIGGLSRQIEQIRDAVELPFLHPEVYTEYGLRPPKGVLLYGPPGNGKTLIAKAVANSLATSVGDSDVSYFLNIKGPELLNKFVGETERQLRQIFEQARRAASSGRPVIVFFDEMEALFRTRGTGVSSDMESTVVPQLLAELDGVEGVENVIVIGASNREELIDPAILRPGRLDVKIRIERPDASAASDILSKHLTADTPIHPALLEEYGSPEAAADALRQEIVRQVFIQDDEHRYVRLHFADGTAQDLYWSDFLSGAMLANIVDRAKTLAVKEAIGNAHDAASESGERAPHGLTFEHITAAVAKEAHDNEDLPDTTNPAEWARIYGHTSKRVVDMSLF
ncbi:proteasome ATPase [Corynebacterium sp. 320]|uniref:proteasome ATPase n=1 Tax=Corynebacterium TaxID=1716 RepID=UPI00125CA7E2|nr:MULTISPECIES: proteasome ATPase [Corynebacterium]KAB1503628.1 proteasome ATPase [Corynebacterium sp. 320]KAB1553271.1 proteasome ATPase [Corynebacterium sp. 321]KAB1553510.1 proteasome ATPase [Corynebacterium sp. 319]KAB3527764.1 proteasome ATPase [Corynebacterium sp. 250]KAB3540747.1 proteasome ATPase [Corynebacterium sp. 366]